MPRKKGIIRIVIGCVLLLLQILSVLGEMKENPSSLGESYQLVYSTLGIYSFLFFLGRYSVGILGAIFLLSGVIAHRRPIEYKLSSEVQETDKILFCKNCGSNVGNCNYFCPECGEKIKKIADEE